LTQIFPLQAAAAENPFAILQRHDMMFAGEELRVRRILLLAALVVAAVAFVSAQQPRSSAAQDPNDPSGMYSFLREGEFVQLTLEDGKLSGYVSRFGDSDSDKGTFIDQFFDKASLDGGRLSFTTKTVHGTWYEFTGVITKTSGKQPTQEGYRVIKGSLIQHTTDANKMDKPRQREVEFKSFPQDLTKP
jgi:hypothetical protein